jgi:hypothetical protein
VQQNFPPKSPTAVLPRRLGGLVNTGPLSSRRAGWSAIEEQGAPTSFCVLLLSVRAIPSRGLQSSVVFSSTDFSLWIFLEIASANAKPTG